MLVGRKKPYHKCSKCLKKALYFSHDFNGFVLDGYPVKELYFYCEQHKRGVKCYKLVELEGDLAELSLNDSVRLQK